jgi:signal transduction histidine kinase
VQRRLVLALVGTALAAVALVGVGVLILAQIGARSQAETEIDRQLQVAADFVAQVNAGNGRQPSSLDNLGRGLQLDELQLVAVGDDGQVSLVSLSRRGPRGDGRFGSPEPIEGLVLDDDQLERYQAGETVLVDIPGDDVTVVQGLRRVQLTGEAGQLDFGGSLGVSAAKGVVTIGRQARVWFVLAAAAVVGLSLVVARWLARRLTRPIQAIRQVTASVAGGNFEARVAVEGDDELADLGRAVNQMAGDLQRSRALDQQFLLSVSHDLRTPLTAITGYAEALSDGATDDPAHAGWVIGTHAGRLERLVGDLLDLAKLDANRFQLHLQLLDVAVVVGRTVAGLVPTAERYGLDLVFSSSAPAPARVDPDRLAQVVANLVDNALKFARTRVMVTVGTGPGQVTATVTDDGPGIPAADLPHVFERLYVSSAQPVRAENPSGMGLAIVRELATAMGGGVQAASGPGGGTTMTLRLPLAEEPGDSAQGNGRGTTSTATDSPARSTTVAAEGAGTERLR